MKITREHYNQLKENFKATRNLMTEEDCEIMRVKLNKMREQLAFESCVQEWKEGKTINCHDFLRVCESLGVIITASVSKWIMENIMEVGINSYSCIGKLHKTKEKTLQGICEELSSKIACIPCKTSLE